MPDQPEWSLVLGNALDMRRFADAETKRALSIRCDALDSGGARCTADRVPEHEHRIDYKNDLPEGS